MQIEARRNPSHHDLHDVIVSVLAVDQVDQVDQVDRRFPSEEPCLLEKQPKLRFGGSRESDPFKSSQDKLNSIVTRQLGAEPMNDTLDYIRIQTQRMYIRRQRVGFWQKAVLSLLLLSVLGFVFYFFLASDRSIELSSFF